MCQNSINILGTKLTIISLWHLLLQHTQILLFESQKKNYEFWVLFVKMQMIDARETNDDDDKDNDDDAQCGNSENLLSNWWKNFVKATFSLRKLLEMISRNILLLRVKFLFFTLHMETHKYWRICTSKSNLFWIQYPGILSKNEMERRFLI